ncbi:uncharacterized protein [Patagioenas fasciata]|uniref:Uncharacterized protein n=1 Tax=Patagioenas fasciata monilis TaxID=372326 RepID=A0A1V4KSN1_PATFA|nr:hypothetical protein AV530_000910 [Patagioenas fasciata monilis]
MHRARPDPSHGPVSPLAGPQAGFSRRILHWMCQPEPSGVHVPSVLLRWAIPVLTPWGTGPCQPPLWGHPSPVHQRGEWELGAAQGTGGDPKTPPAGPWTRVTPPDPSVETSLLLQDGMQSPSQQKEQEHVASKETSHLLPGLLSPSCSGHPALEKGRPRIRTSLSYSPRSRGADQLTGFPLVLTTSSKDQEDEEDEVCGISDPAQSWSNA